MYRWGGGTAECRTSGAAQRHPPAVLFSQGAATPAHTQPCILRSAAPPLALTAAPRCAAFWALQGAGPRDWGNLRPQKGARRRRCLAARCKLRGAPQHSHGPARGPFSPGARPDHLRLLNSLSCQPTCRSLPHRRAPQSLLHLILHARPLHSQLRLRCDSDTNCLLRPLCPLRRSSWRKNETASPSPPSAKSTSCLGGRAGGLVGAEQAPTPPRAALLPPTA